MARRSNRKNLRHTLPFKASTHELTPPRGSGSHYAALDQAARVYAVKTLRITIIKPLSKNRNGTVSLASYNNFKEHKKFEESAVSNVFEFGSSGINL